MAEKIASSSAPFPTLVPPCPPPSNEYKRRRYRTWMCSASLIFFTLALGNFQHPFAKRFNFASIDPVLFLSASFSSRSVRSDDSVVAMRADCWDRVSMRALRLAAWSRW